MYLLTFCRARASLLYSSSLALQSVKLFLISWSESSCKASRDANLIHRGSTDGWDMPTTWSHCFSDGMFLTSLGSSSAGILALATSCLLKSLTSLPCQQEIKKCWLKCNIKVYLSVITSMVRISCWISSALVEHWVLRWKNRQILLVQCTSDAS